MKSGVFLLAMLLLLSQFSVHPVGIGAAPPLPEGEAYADIGDILLSVTSDQLQMTVRQLQDLGTRYYSTDNNTRAADYIEERFARVGLQVERQPYTYSVYTLDNVIATLPGTDTHNNEVYIVTSHFDSISNVPLVSAPGADDNGSGTAAVIALAEIMAQYRWNATIRFITFNGEEVGLTGSEAYATRESADGNNITGVFNLDMIAYNNGDVDLDIAYTNESEFPTLNSWWMVEALANATADFGINVNVTGRFRGKGDAVSDHYPFWDNGYDAVLGIERINPDYPYYHTTGDTVDKLNFTYHRDVARTVLGAMATLAGINSTDVVPPSHSRESPADQSWATSTTVNISLEVTDPSGVNASSISVTLNGAPVGIGLTPCPFGYSVYTGDTALAEGSRNDVVISASDTYGNAMTWNWSFKVDSIPPAPPTNIGIDTVGGSVEITWTASVSDDVDHYLVEKANVPNDPSAWVVHERTTGTSSLHFAQAGQVSIKFYRVRAVDRAGNIERNDIVLGKNTIALEEGWNLVGVPFRQEYPQPYVVFDYLTGYWDALQMYNATGQNWDFLDPAAPAWYPRIDSTDQGSGMWFRTTAASKKICVTGGVSHNVTIPLKRGWNLVAYPGYDVRAIPDVLTGVPYDNACGFSATAEYRVVHLSPTDTMSPGYAYWIHMVMDYDWTYQMY